MNKFIFCLTLLKLYDRLKKLNVGEFPSGQRGQTVNLLALLSKVRILPLPFLARVAELVDAQDLKSCGS